MATMVQSRTGANFQHIPYKGAAPALVDVVSGKPSRIYGPVLISMVRSRARDLEAFSEAWQVNGRSLGSVRGLVCHNQNVVRPESVPMPIGRGPWQLDGLSQMHFASIADLQEMLESDQYAQYLERMKHFASHCMNLTARRHVVIPNQKSAIPGVDKLKRMSLLQRQPGVTSVAFHKWWLERHGPKVARIGTLSGANQFHVYAGRLVFGSPDEGFDQVPDGVTELVLPDIEAMLGTFSPTGAAITDHAATMIGTITPKLMRNINQLLVRRTAMRCRQSVAYNSWRKILRPIWM